MTVDLFQAAVELHYSETLNLVSVATYDMNGRAVYSPTPLKHENLPLLLFQLADRGYQIEPERHQPEGYKVIRAYSPEYWAKIEAAAVAEFLETAAKLPRG